MKKIRLILYFFLLTLNLNIAQNYTAKLRVEDLYWYQYADNSPEWTYTIYADLYLDGELQTPNNGYQYKWWKKIVDQNGNHDWVYLYNTDYNDDDGDGQTGMSVLRYVKISGPGFSVISDTVEVKYDHERSIVNLTVKLQNGNNLQPENYLKVFTNPHWEGPGKTLNDPLFAVTKEETNYIKTEPFDLPNYNQKFNYWNSKDKIINFYNYYTSFDNNNLTSHFKDRRKNITVQKTFSEYPNSEIIGFKDPWLMDEFVNENLGTRNRGNNAPFKYYNSINFASSSFDDYKGVFLNQSGPPKWTPPYYEISIPASINVNGTAHKINLLNWDTTNAALQYPNQLTTGVVFNNANATVTANLKGSLLSNNINAYKNNSQRKIVRIANGDLYMVYESLGKVWLEQSTDNGSTWSLMNGGKPLSGSSEAKNPAIDFYGNTTAVVYQEKAGNYFNIKLIII